MSSANGSEMKRTGIIRRIDDLGRIVIPREIRNILRIRENDPLEMFVHDNAVVLVKYQAQKPVLETLDVLQDLVQKDPNLKCGGGLQEKIREMAAILNQEMERSD